MDIKNLCLIGVFGLLLGCHHSPKNSNKIDSPSKRIPEETFIHIAPERVESGQYIDLSIKFTASEEGLIRLDQKGTHAFCYYRVNETENATRQLGAVLHADEKNIEIGFSLPALQLKPDDTLRYYFEFIHDGNKTIRPGGNLKVGSAGGSATVSKPILRLSVLTEDSKPEMVKIELKTEKPRRGKRRILAQLSTGTTELLLPDVPEGRHHVYFSSFGYAPQWKIVVFEKGVPTPAELDVKLFRKRYVVLRYAINTLGDNKLSGPGVMEGRLAVAHWRGLPYFGEDWQVWQSSSSLGRPSFGDTPFLEFHRYGDNFGFLDVSEELVFEDLKEAPLSAGYKGLRRKAVKGLTLFCRIDGDKGVPRYGKVLVEDVTETPPLEIERLESR